MISLKEKSDIPTDENIHAFDLFENEKRRIRNPAGKLISTRIVHSKIDTFFERLSSLIDGADIQSMVFCMCKDEWKKKITDAAITNAISEKDLLSNLKGHGLHDFLYEALARKMILEFGHFLESKDGVGEIMAESRREDDSTVLSAYLSSTRKSTFEKESRYAAWAELCRKRITSLTFQNKKGLSFGLEVADLFAWAHFNKKHGRSFPMSSVAKQRRAQYRINQIDKTMTNSYLKKPEDISPSKLKSISNDRISAITQIFANL